MFKEIEDIDISLEQKFKTPYMATDNIRDFFKVANLGPSDPSDPNSGPFNKFLLVAHNGITTRTIMTILFNIYTVVNDMQKDPKTEAF